MTSESKQTFRVTIISIVGILGIIAALMFTIPSYRVWMCEMRGKAAAVEAEQNRQIKITEAQANLEAEKLNAQAEIERAKGAAQAIEIENGKLTPTYIQYLWVRQQNLDQTDKLIYIPTEAGLPILEAGRMVESPRPPQTNTISNN